MAELSADKDKGIYRQLTERVDAGSIEMAEAYMAQRFYETFTETLPQIFMQDGKITFCWHKDGFDIQLSAKDFIFNEEEENQNG